MDPLVTSSIILVGGGVVLALSAMFVIKRNADQVRDRARLAEMEARFASLLPRIEGAEAVAADALDVATKARRIASRRQTKAERESGDALEVDVPGPRALPADPFTRMRAEAERQLAAKRNGAGA